MPTVLLIDDDVESRKKVARLFIRQGWQVIEALEGKAGIELAFAKRPDAIVCDLLLPKMSGLQVARAIREKLDLARIIITAGRRYDIDRETVVEAGGDDYFLKPLSWEKLSAALKRPRRKARPATSVGRKTSRCPRAAPRQCLVGSRKVADFRDQTSGLRTGARHGASAACSSNSSASLSVIAPPSSSASTMVTARR